MRVVKAGESLFEKIVVEFVLDVHSTVTIIDLKRSSDLSPSS